MPPPARLSRAARRSRGAAARLAGAACAVVAGLAALTGPAHARVTATGTPAAPGTTRVTFAVEPACAGAATTAVRVRLPAGTSDVTPEPAAGWTARHLGDELVWTADGPGSAGPLWLSARMMVPGAVGDVVYFPTVQECPGDDRRWTAAVADPAAPDAAPRIVLAVSYVVRRPPTTPAGSATSSPRPLPPPPRGQPGRPEPWWRSGWTIVALVAVAGLTVTLGGAMLARRRSGGIR